MMGKTHMLGGLAAGAGLTFAVTILFPDNDVELVSAGAFMTSATISALLPDVDEKNSKAGKSLFIIPATLSIIKIILFLIELFSFGHIRKQLKEKRKALSHRGIFHWLITWGILSILAVAAGIIMYLCLKNTEQNTIIPLLLSVLSGFIVGYLSHILLDLISGRIQLLAPFNKKWYGIRFIKVGSIAETILIRPILIAATGLLLYWAIR